MLKMDCVSAIQKTKSSIGVVLTIDAKNDVQGKGSAFVFWKKGILVTCNHVVDKSSEIKVKFPDSKGFFDAKIVLQDPEHDLALLKFEDSTREPLVGVKSSEIKEGMAVIFSGYPLGLFDLTTHQGILSAIIKDVTGITTYLIDGTVNSGNSGCPLMTINGEVIGVVNAKRREQSDLLAKIEDMKAGAISLHGIDLVKIYQALISNVQLGIGYAVPCSYIPKHHDPEIDTTNGIQKIDEKELKEKGFDKNNGK